MGLSLLAKRRMDWEGGAMPGLHAYRQAEQIRCVWEIGTCMKSKTFAPMQAECHLHLCDARCGR